MGKSEHARRVRLVIAWALSAVIIGGYYLSGDEEAEQEVRAPRPPPTAATPSDNDNLEIVDVIGDVTPGSAVQLRFLRGDPPNAAPVRAVLSTQTVEGTQAYPLEIVHAQKDEIVVRIPKEAKPAKYKLRLQHGDDRGTRSKPYDVKVKAVNRKKLFRNVIGGLALLVFGLTTMSSGSRAYAGHRGQGVIAGIARRTPTAVGLGVAVGGITQFTTTAAGLVVGLIESHLLTAGPAAAVLLGAQLGAAAVPSLLGLTSTAREGLVLVSIGVLWLSLAGDRRGKALGNILLGCGLLFYGLNLLRIGFEPLVSDPEIIPYIDQFQADRFTGLIVCVGAGALLSAILQGPAPVFALVLGLTQASGQLDLQSALAILAGTGFGASIGTAVVSWPFGAEARRLARLYFLMALVGTVLLAATVDVWAFVADRLVSGRPDEVAYGKKVLLPHVGKHLVLGFALSQLAATAVLAVLLPLVLKAFRKLTPTERGSAPPALTGEEGARALREGLSRVVGSQRRALAAILDVCLTGHRARSVEGEHALADAWSELNALFGGAVRTGGDHPELGRLRQAALTTLQLQRAVEDLWYHAERSTERAMALSPAGETWQMAAADAATLKSLHGLVLEGIDGLEAQFRNGAVSDLDAARAREIRLNAMEAETRQGLLADRGESQRGIALRLNNTDLVNAYENVGNHLYRLYESLAAEVEQDAV